MKKNDWKARLGVTYSTNPDYRYRTEEGAEGDAALPREKQMLRVSIDKRRRGGKTVTLVTGFSGADDDLQTLGRLLKTGCASGGSVKDGEIIIQGDCRQKALELLRREGYAKSRIV
ncbi:MAG: translation initiation factor [Tannerella sp.]|jgi:translation initiation factor 1|nr:translation initiation factor [Tannerella sp.]